MITLLFINICKIRKLAGPRVFRSDFLRFGFWCFTNYKHSHQTVFVLNNMNSSRVNNPIRTPALNTLIVYHRRWIRNMTFFHLKLAGWILLMIQIPTLIWIKFFHQQFVYGRIEDVDNHCGGIHRVSSHLAIAARSTCLICHIWSEKLASEVWHRCFVWNTTVRGIKSLTIQYTECNYQFLHIWKSSRWNILSFLHSFCCSCTPEWL